jgi:hypothetical protein
VGPLFSSRLHINCPCAFALPRVVAVTIVSNDVHKVFCALFHDTADGSSFSAFIAREILEGFIGEYGAELGAVGHNLRDFHRFQYRIQTIVRESAKLLLRKRTFS